MACRRSVLFGKQNRRVASASLRDHPHFVSPIARNVELLPCGCADGPGPFVAAYLASSGWNPGSVGYALTFGGLVTVVMQTPAGAIVDAVRRKRQLVIASLTVLVCGAVLLTAHPSVLSVYGAQFLIGGATPFLLPTVTAITLGIVGAQAFDKQFGKTKPSTPPAMCAQRF